MSKISFPLMVLLYINQKYNETVIAFDQDLQNIINLFEEWDGDLNFKDIEDYLVAFEEKYQSSFENNFFKKDVWLYLYIDKQDLEIERHNILRKMSISLFDAKIVDFINQKINESGINKQFH